MNGKKLAIVCTHPIQYQVPIWRKLAQDPLLDIHVYYGSDFSVRGYEDKGFGTFVKWDVPLTYGYAHTFLSHSTERGHTSPFLGLNARNLASHLSAFRPDVVLITGYMPLFWWETVWIAGRLNIPILIRAETTDVARSRTHIKNVLRRALLRLFYKQCAYFLAIGSNSRAHYSRLGIPAGKIGWSPYCIDTDLFDSQRLEYLPQRDLLRRELGFSNDQTVFIYSGKLIQKKDPLTLARALHLIPSLVRSEIGLIVLGDGELRDEFEAECRKALGDRAAFVGFVNQTDMGRYYIAADCLTLPSVQGETWGLVVNEALQFGRPAVVSDRVGCHRDLVIPGKTGFVFQGSDESSLALHMLAAMAMLKTHRPMIAKRCRQQVSQYSLDEAVEGIRSAVAGM